MVVIIDAIQGVTQVITEEKDPEHTETTIGVVEKRGKKIHEIKVESIPLFTDVCTPI